MKRKYRIHFWHGYAENSAFHKKIESICELVDDVYYFDGTLDEFDSLYDGNFIYIKADDNGVPFLGVTYHRNFSCR